MDYSYLPFVLFVIAMTGTPGPGNLTMLAVGQATGFRSAMPLLAGAAMGSILVTSLAGMGVGELFLRWPKVEWMMKAGGMLYILYLAGKVLGMQLSVPSLGNRFTFWDGLLLHPLSPKSWAMVVVGYSQFSDPAATVQFNVAMAIVLFTSGLLIFHSLWCLAGVSILSLLKSKRLRKGVNLTIVVIMVGATVYAMVI